MLLGGLEYVPVAISVSVIKACPNILYPWLGLENVLEFMSEVKQCIIAVNKVRKSPNIHIFSQVRECSSLFLENVQVFIFMSRLKKCPSMYTLDKG